MDNLVAEKNDLSQSFLHHSFPSDQDDEMSKTTSNKVFYRDEKSSKTFTFILLCSKYDLVYLHVF